MPDFRRILIVKLSAMGDVVHALPAVTYLRRAAPTAEIHWAVDTRFAELLEGNPGIAKVVSLPIREWKGRPGSPATWREAIQAAGALRGGKYDLAIDLQGNIKSGAVTYLSGAPLRYGFPRETARERQNLWFTNRRPPALERDRHVTRKILRVASAPFGGEFRSDDLKGEVANTAEEIAAAERLLFDAVPGAAPRLAIHPGTTWNTKRMGPAFWAETVRFLRGSFPSMGVFLSWGTEKEREECLAIRYLAGGGVALLPRLGYKALAAVYRACGHMIGPDTGPLHLAAVVGAKTVSVFRGSDGRYAAPLGPDHRFFQAPLPCTACQIKGDKVCPRDAECRSTIKAAEVAAAMAVFISGTGTASTGGEGSMKITAIVITRNEERNIGDCLASIPFADEVIVVDSGSVDRTEEICRRDPRVRWFPEPWKGFGPQKNSALDKAENDWILSIDADERVTPELAEEIASLPLFEPGVDGYRIPRKSFFGKEWVRHGGWYPDHTIRLWRRRAGRFVDRSVHEAVRVEGKVGTLRGDLLHHTYMDTADFVERMNRYSTLGAGELRKKGVRCTTFDLLFRPPFTFFRMYALRMGFLDGALGFRLAVLYAMYTFLKYAKLRDDDGE